MTKIYLLLSGPIRPNIDYVNDLINNFRKMINNDVIVFLSYWEKDNIDKSLIKNVDYIFNEYEPEDKWVFERISSRTKQQQKLNPNIEHWTPRIYKMFYGIKKMVNIIEEKHLINDDDIVLRVRTDLYIEDCNNIYFNNLLKNIEKNTIYNRIRGTCCDWFTVSTYKTFKKIWHIENDDIYNNTIKHLWNAEEIINYRSKLNKINIVNIRNIIKLCICREYNHSTKEKRLQRYG